MVGINFSQETARSVIEQYEFRVDALLKKIDFLEAKLEVSNKFLKTDKMNREKLLELYKKYDLQKEDVYKHQHYVIITRQGIEKIQAKENITINYEVIKCETNFSVFKAKAYISSKPNTILETFGSALKGANYKDGNCNSWYVAEMAEKRALSRAVLKLTGFYELGVFGEDESEDFKKK